MRFSDEFRDAKIVSSIAERLRNSAFEPATIMEVCGTHTMSAARFGLKSLLPEGVRLVSGPGCPVCVTAASDIDAFLALGSVPGAILVSFGDMLRVPGSSTSLERERAAGADVRIVYSPLDAVEIAANEPDKQIVFFGVGFETTMPAVAISIVSAAERKLANFTVFCVHKTMPAALRALLAGGEVKVSGLLLPGHVTTIIGADAYNFIAEEFSVPCAVTGFEPVDMMLGVESILKQRAEGVAKIDNVYARAVSRQANPRAGRLFDEVFEPCDADWRGIGVIPASGIRIRDGYSAFDARERFAEVIEAVPVAPVSECLCGDVLRGVMRPVDCPQFGAACTPSDPVGPCMVSSEGACAAAYRYGGD
jgi:hydrogenase expression/formation protein HypD